MKNKICVIGVYFGKLSNYFPLWLKSVEYNKCVDFLLFTDIEIKSVPSNMKIKKITFTDLKNMIENKLNLPVSLERPYKICDFRPAYGVIFEDYVREYDYWGHCDFDLIWGDVVKYLKEFEYDKYDKFLPLGHLSLYKNTQEVNNYYLKQGGKYDYKNAFTTDNSYGFDEYSGINLILQHNNYSFFDGKIYADISAKYKRYRCGSKLKNYDYQIFYWEDGHVYRDYLEDGIIRKEEFIYIHFKKRANYELNYDFSNCNSFYITNTGFYPKNENTTIEIIEKYNPFKGSLYEKLELTKYNLHKFLGGIKGKIIRAITH